MNKKPVGAGLAAINNALIYYETAGEAEATPFVMIHAGVADSRQWNHEFAHFAGQFRVIRYDLRGYGRSEPVEGEFSHLQDLTALLDYLGVAEPAILMGCSMGGGLALDFALERPSQTAALILVGSAPNGLELDAPGPTEKFEAAEKAYHEGDIEQAAEIETQIWFDGMGRAPAQVNQTMRRLAYEMNLLALSHYARKLGRQASDTTVPAVERLSELQGRGRVPMLVIVGTHDIPYIQAAADYLVTTLPSAQKAVIEDAAHLPNMDQPDEFRHIVTQFLDQFRPAFPGGVVNEL